jgi:hypothetical protein
MLKIGARLRITSLRASAGGPGVEFLEYLAPRTGRAIPNDERANDLSHWQTRLTVGNTNNVSQDVLSNRYIFVSPGVVDLSRGELGFARAF